MIPSAPTGRTLPALGAEESLAVALVGIMDV
jgi:hypothetical protein